VIAMVNTNFQRIALLALCALGSCTTLKPAGSAEQNDVDSDSAVDARGLDGAAGDAAIGDDGAAGDDGAWPEATESGQDCTLHTFYPDRDGDGAGSAEERMQACEAPAGYTPQGGDCDDACKACIVGAAEVCDGRDNDCDGSVDEGVSTACGSMLGVCKPGVQQCVAGKLGACEGGVQAGAEACDGALDEDCDGTVDEDCPCTASQSRACGVEVGECAAGQQVCKAGVWGSCEGGTKAEAEVCDGKDNDCDGQTDEGITMACGTDVGECSVGISTCVDGKMGPCSSATGPGEEVCDGKDNDCDNVVDEGVTRACNTTRAGIGICKAGTETCAAGTFGPCLGSVTPRSEICDAAMLDEDCDGAANQGCACTEGATAACGVSAGACELGSWTCNGGSWGPVCSGGKGPSAETCNNLDDDCDGSTDEGLTRPCGTSPNPPCRIGTETCMQGQWKNCTAVNPGPAEICDALSLDENCDGRGNENCKCVNGSSRSCTVSGAVGICREGKQSCVNGDWAQACAATQQARAEQCNGLDDDCNGLVDDRCPCSKNTDCPTGEGCGSDKRCYPAYKSCASNSACPPGFNCTLAIGATDNVCKPACAQTSDPLDPTLCPLPASASRNIITMCWPLNDAAGTHYHRVLSCNDTGAGGCPFGMTCRGITGACYYP
jgi:hypothetical protein